MKEFDLTIVTPERTTFQGKAAALVLPSWEGSMGVLPGHAAALVLLREGMVKIRDTQDEEELLSLSGGFAEIGPHKVTLFAESAELSQEVDEERARLAAARAKEQITKYRTHQKGYEAIDIEQAQSSLRRALTRLKITEGLRRTRRAAPAISRENQ